MTDPESEEDWELTLGWQVSRELRTELAQTAAKRGARRVVALDVGKNQIDYRIRCDSRVSHALGESVSLPYGLIHFKLELNNPGDEVTVTVDWIEHRCAAGIPDIVLYAPCAGKFISPGTVSLYKNRVTPVN